MTTSNYSPSSDSDNPKDTISMTPPTHSPYFKRNGKPSRYSKKRKMNPNTFGLPYPASSSTDMSIVPDTGTLLPSHRPLPTAKNLNVRSKTENATSAMIFKQLIDDDEDDVFGPVSMIESSRPLDNHSSHPGKSHFEDLFAGKFGVSRRHLRTLSHFEGVEGSEPHMEVSNHLLIGQARPVVQSPSVHFPQEEDDAEQGEVHYGRQTKLFVSEAGCDIPMPRTLGSRPSVRVNFDPDLPPMAVEHPTRVWNSMLHSLSPELQPIVKWTYDEVGEDDAKTWTAHLTLMLPPTHPSVANHPLFYVLPKNRYSAEYVKAIAAIGGIKTWSGQPRKLKTDSQNSALLQCITDNVDALAWVHTPIMATVPDLENESLEESNHMDDATKNEQIHKDEELMSDLPVAKQYASPPNQRTVQSVGVDWIKQLNDFCELSDLPPPRYSQRVERGCPTLFFGLVTLEEEHFQASTPHPNLKAARQQVAEMVYFGHFGQDPVV